MKKLLKLIIVTIISYICFSYCAFALESTDSIFAVVSGNKINMQIADGKYYLLLPSFSDLENLDISVKDSSEFKISGNKNSLIIKENPADITYLSTPDANGEYSVTVKYDNKSVDLSIVKSANITSLFITSDDPENYGREYVSEIFGNKAKGKLKVVTADGDVIYDGVLKEIKGRGNSTWDGSSKKPYQIKLDAKTNLLNDENMQNADKTWVLLANSFDPSLIRNTLTYALSSEIFMEFYPETKHVDLYYDSVYIGSYLLSEKNEISSGRININNFEKQIEDLGASGNITQSTDFNSYGNKYKYSEGVTIPDNPNLGFLMEFEYPNRVEQENCWFSTSNGNYIVIKSPEDLPKEFVKRISERFQEFENAVYSGGTNPYNGKKYSSYIDADSLVKLFAIEQFSKDIDTFMASTYMYAEEDLIFKFGPVWDFDIAYGIGSTTEADENQKTTGFTVFNTDFGKKLMNIPDFNSKFTEFYNNVFSQVVENTILGNTDGEFLLSADKYGKLISKSAYMNYLIWDYVGFNGEYVEWVYDDYNMNLIFLKKFMSNRNHWIKTAVNTNNCLNDIKRIDIYTYYDNVQEETYFSLGEQDYYVAKLLSADNKKIMVKHLSGIEYSKNLKVYINGVSTNYYIDELERVIVDTPSNHNIMPQNSSDNEFKDISKEDWHYEYVYNVYNKGWMKGVTDKRFQPDSTLNKGMVITALYRHSNEPDNKYKYTISSECYNDAADWAVKSGIIFAYEKDFMELRDTVTREEAAMLFYRAYGSPKTDFDLNFSDEDIISEYYLPAVKWCVQNEIFIGDHKNRLNPDNYLTRAEFTKMLTVYGNLTNE